ncbi:MAG TPA: hypothetical protein PKA64_21355 [Myxococcota bacterium]|nr:hypothetical protein [Myxococcota bacterium]
MKAFVLPSISGDAVLIHGFASVSGAIGAGLAQLPGADAPILASVQATMIMALAEKYGVPMHKTAAAELVLTLGATIVGRQMSRRVRSRVPGWGNAVGAVTAFGLTEAMGWAAVRWFREQRA